MGFKRSGQRMKAIEARLRGGMAERGITGETADTIVRSISSFALYGFPESHAASFALIAYASAYLKTHHPAAFVCALLNNQPMGFYHPFTLVKDAQRHGVRFRPVDVTRSGALARSRRARCGWGWATCGGLRGEAGGAHRGGAGARAFASLQDFVDRLGLRRDEERQLAEMGALNAFGLTRRSALWQVEKAGRPRGRCSATCAPRTTSGLSPVPEMDLRRARHERPFGNGPERGAASRLVLPAGARRARRAARRRAAAASGRGLRAGGGRRHLPPAAGHGEGLHVPDARRRDGPRQRDRAPRPVRARARDAHAGGFPGNRRGAAGDATACRCGPSPYDRPWPEHLRPRPGTSTEATGV